LHDALPIYVGRVMPGLDRHGEEFAHGEARTELVGREAHDFGEATIAQRDPAVSVDHAYGLVHVLDRAFEQREPGQWPVACQVQLVQPIPLVGHTAPSFPTDRAGRVSQVRTQLGEHTVSNPKFYRARDRPLHFTWRSLRRWL